MKDPQLLFDPEVVARAVVPPEWWALPPRAHPHELARWAAIEDRVVMAFTPSTGSTVAILHVPYTPRLREAEADTRSAIGVLQALRSCLLDLLTGFRAQGLRVTVRPTVSWQGGGYRLLLAPGPYHGARLESADLARVVREPGTRLMFTRRQLREAKVGTRACAQCMAPLAIGDTAWGDVANGSTRHERVCCTCMDDLAQAGLP